MNLIPPTQWDSYFNLFGIYTMKQSREKNET